MRPRPHLPMDDFDGTLLPPWSLSPLLHRYLAADSWDSAEEILDAHPELLSDAILALLDEEIGRCQDDPERAGELAEERAFLGLARRIGGAAAFCERRIAACERDLAADPDPATRLGLNLQLAASFAARGVGERRDNQERAREAYEQALRWMPRAAMLESWAATTNNLALLCTERRAGRREENLEHAIALYREILDAVPEGALPALRATVWNNLGKALCESPGPDRAGQLAEAASCFERALAFYEEEVAWAAALHNLANVYRERIAGSRPRNVEATLRMHGRALIVRSRQALPYEWAETQADLAATYLQRVAGERRENLERAIMHARQALRVRTRRSLPLEWAQTLGLLGLLYSERVRGRGTDNRRRAEAVFRAALTVLPVDSVPADHRDLQRHRADLYFAEGRWQEASAAYDGALRAAELLYQSGATPEGRDFELGANRELALHAAYSLARAGEAWRAVEVLEQWKTRALAEALARTEALLAALPVDRQEELRRTALRIRSLEVEAREAGLPGNRDFPAVAAELRRARRELAEILAALRATAPELLAGGLTAAGVASVVRAVGRPLAYLVTTPRGSLALLLGPADGDPERITVEPLWLDASGLGEPTLLAVGNPLPLPAGWHPLEHAGAEAAAVARRFDGRSCLLRGEEATRRPWNGNSGARATSTSPATGASIPTIPWRPVSSSPGETSCASRICSTASRSPEVQGRRPGSPSSRPARAPSSSSGGCRTRRSASRPSSCRPGYREWSAPSGRSTTCRPPS